MSRVGEMLKRTKGYIDYNVIIKSFGYNVLLQVDDNDYQGDTRVLFRDGRKLGILIFGWGSCSGCDALQACDGINEIVELAEEMERNIKWGTHKETYKYFLEHDWKGDYSWHSRETKEFREKAVEIIGEKFINSFNMR